MFSATDHDKLQQIMAESPEKKELLTRLLDSHKITISSISHEIRNPLTLVSSTLQLIQSQHPEVTSFKHWDSLMQDIEYMNSLLCELSAYNNSGRLILSVLDTSNYLKTISLSFAASIVDTDIEFISKIEPNLPYIHADSVKLREVILNLLSNAKDAVQFRTNPKISFSSKIKDHFLLIEIIDNGSGISAEQLPHIFEPFVTYKKNGTGLGLAIASQIIHAHGGTLEVSSTPDIITCFTLTLPIQQNS